MFASRKAMYKSAKSCVFPSLLCPQFNSDICLKSFPDIFWESYLDFECTFKFWVIKLFQVKNLESSLVLKGKFVGTLRLVCAATSSSRLRNTKVTWKKPCMGSRWPLHSEVLFEWKPRKPSTLLRSTPPSPENSGNKRLILLPFSFFAKSHNLWPVAG